MHLINAVPKSGPPSCLLRYASRTVMQITRDCPLRLCAISKSIAINFSAIKLFVYYLSFLPVSAETRWGFPVAAAPRDLSAHPFPTRATRALSLRDGARCKRYATRGSTVHLTKLCVYSLQSAKWAGPPKGDQICSGSHVAANSVLFIKRAPPQVSLTVLGD